MPQAQEFKFNFKSRKITDESGKEIGRTKKQPSLVASLPVPTNDEIISHLAVPDSAVAKLVMASVAAVIYGAAREQFDDVIDGFGDDDSQEVNASMLDYDKLDLEFLANLPPSQRGAAALSDEDWAAFFGDYLNVMVAATGKEAARINNHINLFKKPQKAKANKEVLAVLVDQLDIYLASSQNLEETGEAASRLRNKFAKWHAEPEKQVDLSVL